LNTVFANKVVWVTGASSGIGEALCVLLLQQGAKVILSARREDELSRVAQFASNNADNYFIHPLNLENHDDAPIWVEKAIQRFGRIDLLINNGGVSQRSYSSVTSLEVERKLFEINYFAQVAMAKAVLPIFRKQKSGGFIVISSIAGLFGFYSRSTYSAAKHALHGYFDTLRLEEENNGIHVLIVCPGKIKTNVSHNALLSDGSAHNKLDDSHANAMTAEDCAKQILNAYYKNKEQVLIGGKELLMVYLKRYLPSLFSKLIRKVKRD
jgi:short-subunit dehydrogenase